MKDLKKTYSSRCRKTLTFDSTTSAQTVALKRKWPTSD